MTSDDAQRVLRSTLGSDPWCPKWCDPSHCEFRTNKRGAMFHRGTLETICASSARPRVVAWRAQNGYEPDDGQFVVVQIIREDDGGEAESVATYWFKLDESLRMSTILAQLGSIGATGTRGGVPVVGGVFISDEHSPSGPGRPILDTP
jgi:hypothetical protein